MILEKVLVFGMLPNQQSLVQKVMNLISLLNWKRTGLMSLAQCLETNRCFFI